MSEGGEVLQQKDLTEEEKRLKRRLQQKRTDEERRWREHLRAKKARRSSSPPSKQQQEQQQSSSAPPDDPVKRNGNHHRHHRRDDDKDRHHRNHYHHDHPRHHNRSHHHHPRGPPPSRYGPPMPPIDAYDYRAPYPRGPPPSRRPDVDDFGRMHRNGGGGSRSYSRSRSRGRRSYSRSPSLERNRRGRSRSSSSSRSHSPSSRSASSSSVSSRASSYSSSSSKSSRTHSTVSKTSSHNSSMAAAEEAFTKDQRTVFVTQLVLRTTERDIRNYFKSQNIAVREISFLRDKRTGKHKGSAYIELAKFADVAKACALSDTAPDFQRFPILIKASEAEKNYVSTGNPNAPKVYVGNLEINSVEKLHLQAIFGEIGELQNIHMPEGKGYAFLEYQDPKAACLAIHAMNGQVLAGRALKTGWASNSTANTMKEISEFPPDAKTRMERAYRVLSQLTGGVGGNMLFTGSAATNPMQSAQSPSVTVSSSGSTSRVPTVAEARASLMTAHGGTAVLTNPVATMAPTAMTILGNRDGSNVEEDPTKIGNADNPTTHILVHNMFDKDTEVEPDWQNDIREEFIEECSKHGKINTVVVAYRETGGKIYASFAELDGAQKCATSLAGRWFDKRRLRVEFIDEAVVRSAEQRYQA